MRIHARLLVAEPGLQCFPRDGVVYIGYLEAGDGGKSSTGQQRFQIREFVDGRQTPRVDSRHKHITKFKPFQNITIEFRNGLSFGSLDTSALGARGAGLCAGCVDCCCACACIMYCCCCWLAVEMSMRVFKCSSKRDWELDSTLTSDFTGADGEGLW